MGRDTWDGEARSGWLFIAWHCINVLDACWSYPVTQRPEGAEGFSRILLEIEVAQPPCLVVEGARAAMDCVAHRPV